MQFDIARKPNLKLSEHYKDSGWVISHDLGWTQHSHGDTQVLHKGLPGNSCSIAINPRGWTIETDSPRTFPVWTDSIQEQITNCHPLHTKVHNFNSVNYNQGMHIEYNEPSWFSRAITADTEDAGIIADHVCHELVQSAHMLKNFGVPVRAANTGGVDTALVRAALDYAGVKYTTTDKVTESKSSNHAYVWAHHHAAPGNFWGYDQLADTQEPHIQATGFWGDEWMQRNPLYVHLYLQQWDIDITAEFDAQEDEVYMTRFFNKGYRDKIAGFDCTNNPRQQMANMMINDLQMWHMDECLTWTPLCHPEVFGSMLRLPPDAVIGQCLRADFSKRLISTLNPKRLEGLNKHKNNR
jgi:hypothetical protein